MQLDHELACHANHVHIGSKDASEIVPVAASSLFHHQKDVAWVSHNMCMHTTHTGTTVCKHGDTKHAYTSAGHPYLGDSIQQT